MSQIGCFMKRIGQTNARKKAEYYFQYIWLF